MRISSVACCVPLFVALPLLAQQAAVTGLVECRVIDSAGSPVPYARLILKQRASGFARGAETNAQGVARMAGLPSGEYALTASRDGFATVAVESLNVSVGQTVVQRITLPLAAVAEKLEVQERADALETQATNANVALGGDRIEESPAANRNYLNFVLAAPGVASSPRSNSARSPAGMRNPGNDSGFVFAGMRGRNNSISIDGVDNRDETTGGNRVAMGLEMVQEFRVAGTQVSAEFGGAAGGLVNMVTRSGENLWHGDFTMFLQNENLNARNPEAETRTTPRFRRYQPGVSIGGPIRRDRTFFMSALEFARESSQEWSEAPRESAAINQTLLAIDPTATPLRRGLFEAGESDTLASFKASHIFSPSDTVTARFAYSSGRVRNDVQSVDNFTDFSARGSSRTGDHSLVSGWSHIFGPTTFSDLRLQFSRRSVTLTPNSQSPMYDIPGIASFGSSYRLDQDRAENHAEAVQSVQWVRGRHLATIGASIHGVFFDGRLANRYRGIFLYPSLNAFLARRPDLTIQAIGDSHLNLRTTPIGAWAQDRWQIRPSLSLEFGLRWDKQFLPSPFPSTNRNIAPRLGLAWHPSQDSPWVFRAGTGLFFDRYPLEYLSEGILKDGVRGYELFNGVHRATYRPAPGFTSTYSRKLTAGVERKLDADTTVSLEYSDVRGLHLPRIRNAALTLPPTFLLEQTSTSQYRGVAVSVNRRLSNEFTYLISYSLSKTQDDASDFDEQPLDPANTRLDWSLSRLHQRHRLSLSGVYEIPLDDWKSGGPAWLRESLQEITLAPVVTYGTGRPLNQLLTTDAYNTAAYPITARPAGFRRNADLMPRIASIDLRVMKTIPIHENRARLQFGVEAFNLMNHSNRMRVSGYYTSSYKGVIEVLNPRQLQLMIQFEY